MIQGIDNRSHVFGHIRFQIPGFLKKLRFPIIQIRCDNIIEVTCLIIAVKVFKTGSKETKSTANNNILCFSACSFFCLDYSM